MAAKSLKCGQCGTLLASVREAQNHNEVTGHTQFEETEEVIKVLKCQACGKSCRSDAERMLHSRHTGHTDYAETYTEAVINTEQQMQEARMDLDEDAALIKSTLKKDKGGAAGAEGAAGAGGAAATTGESTGAGAGAGAGAAGATMVEPAVDAAMLAELEGMGFGRNKAVRALYHTGGAGVEAAVNWVVDHEGDTDLDNPLLVTQASEDVASQLTPEERRKKAADLIKSIREKREKEERELAAHRERERIRAGKEILAAKKQEDDTAMRRMVEQRQRDKEEEAKARAKIQAQLDEDRKERRRKLGLPEELTDEEKARERDKAAAAAAKVKEEKQKIFGHVKPVSVIDKLRRVLRDMKKAHAGEEERWKTAATTLSKYIANVAQHPGEEKYRTIRTSNAAFQQRVAPVTGSQEFLTLCGFQGQGEALVLPQEAVNTELLQAACAALNDMLTNPFFGAL